MIRKIMQFSKLQFGLSLFWFLFTSSLVVWWWIFSLNQLKLLSEVIDPAKYISIERMLIWEGAVLVFAVVSGGLVLIVLTNRERKRNQTLRNFFSNFTHDLKTSLTRLRLRTEVMVEQSKSEALNKLLEEVNRLDLQLENSLWVARGDSQKLLSENIRLSEVIGSLRVEWPELEINLQHDGVIVGDAQALKSIFRNLLQNAWLHGQASKIEISTVFKNSFLEISILDNGKGFNGDIQSLGVQLLEAKSHNSNGLGLFLTRDLVQQMQGEIFFKNTEKGFLALLRVKGQDSK